MQGNRSSTYFCSPVRLPGSVVLGLFWKRLFVVLRVGGHMLSHALPHGAQVFSLVHVADAISTGSKESQRVPGTELNS